MALLPLLLFASLPSLSAAQATGGNLSNCRGGCELGELCVSNPFLQPGVEDSACQKCAGGREYWPCNFETVCHCNAAATDAPRVPPAPRSGEKANEEVDACRDVLTQEVFNSVVRPATLEGNALFTYKGLCDAMAQYNQFHDEKFAGMGTEEQIRRELAAFLAHTAVDTFGYSVTREEMHCVEPITGTDGNVYCKPCKEEHYNPQMKACGQSYFDSGNPSYEAYCDGTRQPPSGCGCDATMVGQANVPGNPGAEGYVLASEAFFKRGALQTEWNYEYYGASLALTGTDFLCTNPDLVATDPVYAWGVAISKWMEKMIFGTQGATAHKQALKGNFGGGVKVLHGALECPADKWTSEVHVGMVKERVSQICKTGSALGVFLEIDRCDNPRDGDCLACEGLKELYESCSADGTCPDCPRWTEFVRSSAPTVTPLRVESPTWDDWANNYGTRSSARRDALTWPVLASVLLLSVATLVTAFCVI